MSKVPTNWVKVAVKIAMIFGAYADMLSENVLTADEKFDIAVDATDFIDPLAALYAKNMGLPIHMILCASADSDGIWDLIHRGQISTATVSDALSLGIERLIYSVYGSTEAGRYVDALKERKSYSVDAEIERSLLEHFFCAVVGSSRIGTVVNSVERTDKYTLCTEAALAYGAIQDYRAKTGENRVTLLFSNQDPN